MRLPLRARIGAFYATALLFPAASYFWVYQGQKAQADVLLDQLGDRTARIEKRRLELEEATRRRPHSPKPPGPAERMDALAGLRVPGVSVVETGRDLSGHPRLSLALSGGYREIVSFLNAAGALPSPGRLRSLTLSRPEGEEALEALLVMEVSP